MDELTQQNAALVEQASAASQAMAEQARDLNTSMVRYQVNTASNTAAANVSVSAAETAAAAERRKTGRPWTGPRTAAAAKPEPRVSTRAANAASDTEWKEF
jgi:hypothetical protein